MKIKINTQISGFLLSVGTGLLPIYIFASGGMQPSHMILIIFIVFTIISFGLIDVSWSLLLLILSIYIYVIEVYYTSNGNSVNGLMNFSYYFFNYLLTQAVFIQVIKQGLKSTTIGITIAALLVMINVSFSGINFTSLEGNGRETATFNNPNQLGFFAVCLLSITYLFYTCRTLNYIFAFILFFCAVFLSILSLSKAAMVTNLIVILFAVKPEFSKQSLALWAITSFGTGCALIRLFWEGFFDEVLFIERLKNMSTESDSSISERGYWTFLEGNMLQNIFGMGSQNIENLVGHEVHSTIGSVLNNYGFVGLFLLLSILIIWSVNIYKTFGASGLLLIVAPPMLYGLTHNGVRFVFFWILFAASLAMAKKLKTQRF